MKKLIALAVFVLLLALPFSVCADKVYVIDNAGLLTEEEASQLEARLQLISAEAGADVVVLTEDDLGGQDVVAYADDFFDYNGYGQGTDRDGVLLLLAMDTRTWYISTSGRGIPAFTDQRINTTGDKMVSYLSRGDYYSGFMIFAEQAESYFASPIGDYMLYDNGDLVTFDAGGHIAVRTNLAELQEDTVYAISDDGRIYEASSLENTPDSFTYFLVRDGELYEVNLDNEPGTEKESTLPYLGAGIGSGVTGLLASLAYVSSEKRKLRTVNSRYQASEYYRDGSMNVSEAKDVFLYRNVSRSRIERSSSSSHSSGGGGGGSHVHISSSGHTHGGGGGHF